MLNMGARSFWAETLRFKRAGDQPNTNADQARRKCAHRPEPSPTPCPTCKSDRKRQLVYRWKIILGLFLPFAISALDVTIVASALPWIAADFGQLPQLNWIISAYNLPAAAFIPFWGQMADIFGRHVSIQTCMMISLVGAALSTGAPTSTFGMLLFGRALQGLGSAGMDVIIRAIVADKVSLKEDAKNWSIFSMVGGVSFAIGPIIGGYLTNSSWRWCFGIGIPVGVASCIVVFFVLRKELLGPQPIARLQETTETGRQTTFKARLQTIDVGGQVLCLFGFALVILALTWSGATYDWGTPAVLVPLVTGACIVVAFLVWQYHMQPGKSLGQRFPYQQAMIPWEVISTRDIGLLFYTSMTQGISMYSVLYFCNLYFTMVKHLEPSHAGRQLLFYVPGLGTGVYLSIFLCNTWPRQTWHPILLGALIQAAGIGTLAWALWDENDNVVYGMMALAGVGAGMLFMPVPLHAMGYFPKRIAAVISLSEVSYPFGGVLGLTIMTTVFNNVVGFDVEQSNDLSEMSRMSSEELGAIAESAKRGIVWAYVAICPFLALCLLACSLLGNVFISNPSDDGDEGQQHDDQENTIYQGVFLWALIRGQKVDRSSNKVVTTRRDTFREDELPRAASPQGRLGERRWRGVMGEDEDEHRSQQPQGSQLATEEAESQTK